MPGHGRAWKKLVVLVFPPRLRPVGQPVSELINSGKGWQFAFTFGGLCSRPSELLFFELAIATLHSERMIEKNAAQPPNREIRAHFLRILVIPFPFTGVTMSFLVIRLLSPRTRFALLFK